MRLDELLINGHIAPNYRGRVMSELINVLKFCPSLHATLMSYIDNMGNESMLITLDGTVPMSFRGNTYYTPVNIFIPSEYPLKSPIVFVRPSASMTIKVDHPNVTPNGECTHSYFRSWDPAFNTLSGTVKTLSDDFSKVSPLFSKVPNSNVRQPQRQYVQQQPSQKYVNPGPAYPKIPSPAMTPSSISHSPSGAGPYPYQPAPVPKPITAREQLSGKVRGRLARDSEAALELRNKLYLSEVELTRELAYLQEMERMLPRLSAEMDRLKNAYDAESASIEAELKEYNDLRENGGTAKLAEAVVPTSGLTEQALTEYAKRDALEDVMYELMKRMNPENCDSILRLIRNAASDQFVSVALIEKIQSENQSGGKSPAPR